VPPAELSQKVQGLVDQLTKRSLSHRNAIEQRLKTTSDEEHKTRLEWLKANAPNLPSNMNEVVCIDSSDMNAGIAAGYAGFPSLVERMVEVAKSIKREPVPSSYLRLQSLLASVSKKTPLLSWSEVTQTVQEQSSDEGLLTTRGLLGRAIAFLHLNGKSETHHGR